MPCSLVSGFAVACLASLVFKRKPVVTAAQSHIGPVR
jgi:hypothetical protein